MSRALALAALAVAVASGSSDAQIAPHLVPEVGPLSSTADDYDRAVGEALDALQVDGLSFAVDHDVIARAVTTGGLGTPDARAVVVRRTPDGYVGLWAMGSPWYEGRDETGWGTFETMRSVPYQTGSAPLDSAVARTIGAVWALAVLGTRHQRLEEISTFTVIDGSTTHFARWIETYGVAGGLSQGAPEGSPAERLARLSGMLTRYLDGDETDPEYVVTRDDLLAYARDTFRAFDPEGRYELTE